MYVYTIDMKMYKKTFFCSIIFFQFSCLVFIMVMLAAENDLGNIAYFSFSWNSF